MLSKTLAVAVIILLSLSVTPSIGIPFNDDTTPPVTSHTLNPPEPDGLNGWYVSDINATLTATDDISGVNITYYRIDRGEWIVYTEPFTLSEDGDDILIEYYSVDYAENIEDVKSFMVDIDQTKPTIEDMYYEVMGWTPLEGWEFIYTTIATDDTSRMERVEFYKNNYLMETVYGKGPEYHWYFYYHPYCLFRVVGLIHNLEITHKYIKFRAIVVIVIGPFLQGSYSFETRAYDKAGNWDYNGYPWGSYITRPGLFLFKDMELPNNYEGYVGKNFIRATFDGDM